MPNPLEIVVRDFPSPEILDGLIVETWDVNKGSYKPIPVGTRIDEGTDSIYAGYELVAQKSTGDYRFVQRFWANVPRNQSVYNASVDDDEGDSGYPIITRRSLVRRPYSPTANGSILGQVLGAVVTNGGSGYTVAPTVTFSAGSATAEAIIYRGVVVYIRITAVGSGYAAAPTITFSGGSGAGAAATAYIQTAGTALVSEKLEKLPQDDPRFGLYDVLMQVYMRLPGPRVIRKGYDLETKAAVRMTKQRVVPTTATTTLETAEVFNGILMYCKDSAVVPVEDQGTVMAYLTETFMELPTDILTVYDQDEETLVVVTTTYEVVLLSSITAPTPVTGFIINYKKIDGTTALKITRDFTEFLEFEYHEQRFAGDTFPDLWDYTQFFWTNGCGAFSSERSQFSAHTQTDVRIYFTASVQTITGLVIQPSTIKLGHAVNLVNVLNDAGTIFYIEPDCLASTSFPASDPSYTTYIDDIQGTMQIVAGSSELWKALIWKNMEVSELML